MKKTVKKILYFIFVIIFIISMIYIINYFISIGKTKSNIEEIRKIMSSENNSIEDNENSSKNNYKIEQLNKLKEQNEEIVAWLEIEGTEINYPVLQTNNNEYYLTRNYKKEYDKNGSIFLDYRYDFTKPSDNLLIYGHNNNNGLMFDNLLEYENKSYYEKHKIINLTTENEDAKYKIIAVLKSRAYENLQNEFLYYNYIDFTNDYEYYNYIDNCKNNSLYEISENIDTRTKILTLSTCEYSKKNGRLAVVAIKIT